MGSNVNNKPDQFKTLTDLGEILDCVGDIQSKKIIFGDDFNVIFYSFLQAQGETISLKKQTLAKKIKINYVDIWRIQNPQTKHFTFRQQHIPGIIQRKLDYFFIRLNCKRLLKTDILAVFTSDHSPLIFTLNINQDKACRKSLWKFSKIDKENIRNDQARR